MSVQGNLGFLACPSRSEVVLRTVGPYLTQVLSRQSSEMSLGQPWCGGLFVQCLPVCDSLQLPGQMGKVGREEARTP
jgi:hypothetical protein